MYWGTEVGGLRPIADASEGEVFVAAIKVVTDHLAVAVLERLVRPRRGHRCLGR